MTAAGKAIGLLAKVWLRTLRLTVVADAALDTVRDRPWVLAFFHGKQWPLLAWKRRRPTVVLVSLSRDGELQTSALSTLGLSVVRGSSSRGGARGLAAMVRVLRRGDHDAALAVDGPRGPYGVPKPGVLLAARAAGAVIVPMGSAMSRGTIFERAWDRFALAWPLSRAGVVLGPPIDPASTLGGDDAMLAELASSIRLANGAAEELLAAR